MTFPSEKEVELFIEKRDKLLGDLKWTEEIIQTVQQTEEIDRIEVFKRYGNLYVYWRTISLAINYCNSNIRIIRETINE